ncbi:uncharacterized protein [Euphorbia lathyris]|uniref:uncharacterized protein n=1 Tax=Euphorbia lathyris TaxID=212925 RepID=UPI0033142242
MEGSVKSVESWLPTEFNKNEFTSAFKSGFNFPTEFPYEFDLFGSSSSPDESVVGSTETESSEDDDFLAGLTRRLTQKLTVKPEKQRVMAGSPESTLSGIGSWSVSSNGSPNGVLSPPTTPFGVKNDTWDLIYAAAGQVARLKMNSELGNKFDNMNQGRGVFSQEAELKNQNIGFFSNQNSFPHMNQYHSEARNGQVLKPRCSSPWEKQQAKVCWQARPQPQPQSHYQPPIQSRNRVSTGYENGGRCVRPLGLPQSAWPPLEVPTSQHSQPQQQQPSSGMRAVFLSGSGMKKERAGTGVFLPRRYGNPCDSKKKSTCSTALLPPRVVQALNLKFEDMNMYGDSHLRLNSFPSDYDAMMGRRNVIVAQQKRNVLNNHEVRLPQEWTY